MFALQKAFIKQPAFLNIKGIHQLILLLPPFYYICSIVSQCLGNLQFMELQDNHKWQISHSHVSASKHQKTDLEKNS